MSGEKLATFPNKKAVHNHDVPCIPCVIQVVQEVNRMYDMKDTGYEIYSLDTKGDQLLLQVA